MAQPSKPLRCVLLLTLAVWSGGCGSSNGSEPRSEVARPVAATTPANPLSDAAKSTDSDLQFAAERMQMRDWKAAAERLTRVLNREPSASAFLARGICHDRMWLDNEALADFASAEKLEAANASIYVARAAFHQRREQPDQGLSLAQRALEIEPNNSDAQLLIALLKLQREIKAALDAEKTGEILSLMETNISWRVDMPGLTFPGGYDRVSQATATAENEIRQIIEQNPNSAAARAELGRILFDRAMLELAKAEWYRLLDRPDASQVSRHADELLNRASQALGEALRLDPTHPQTLAWQAAARHALIDIGDRAFVEQLRKAMQMDPFDRSVLRMLAASLRMTDIGQDPPTVNQVQSVLLTMGDPAIEAVAQEFASSFVLKTQYEFLAHFALESGLPERARPMKAKFERYQNAHAVYEQLIAKFSEQNRE